MKERKSGSVKKAKILIIDHQPESRASLERLLSDGRHQVVAVPDGPSALRKIAGADFDLIISDLAIGNHDGNGDVNGLHLIAEISRKAHAPVVISTDATGQNIHKAFRAGAANYLLRPYDRNELEKIIEKALAYQARFKADAVPTPGVREVIEIELPSDVKYLDGVLSYLIERTVRYGIISPTSSNTFVALDEALSNAIRHGNKNDPSKKVHIRVELSHDEARFTIRDEGPGFNPTAIPDPLDPANLFKNSGRGVLLIQHIMDEVSYNESGNEITMVKRPERR